MGPFINGKQVLYRCVKRPREKTVFEPGLGIFSSAFQEGGKETRFYSLDKKFLSLQPLQKETALGEISNLISIYERGMRKPLPFFPESSTHLPVMSK